MRARTGLTLKIRRIRAGIKQYEVAARVGISACRLSEIELGRRRADHDLAARIRLVIKRMKAASGKRSWH